MTKFLIIALFFLLAYGRVSATSSIILIDPETMEIGIAAASCSHNCYGIGRIISGKGAIIVQAMSSREAREKGINRCVARGNHPGNERFYFRPRAPAVRGKPADPMKHTCGTIQLLGNRPTSR